jgi:allophanate hydrolase
MNQGPTPVAAAEGALAADRAHADPAIWITRLPDEDVLANARRLEAEGPRGRRLWGVPFAVKDNIDIAGLPTTAACPGYAYIPAATAPAVQRLLDEGALLVGKANLDQFATGLVGTRSPYGVPRNVFDEAHVPGGSSSGSACAVAAGIVHFALGTDTAGSGRVPAAFGNIVGLKPTLGSISARGVVPACRSLDTVSVLARSVDEALEVQRVIAGYDDDDPYSRRAPFDYLRRGAPLPTPRIATVETVDISLLLEVARLLYEGPWVAERTAEFRELIEQHPDMLRVTTRTVLEGGLTRRTVDAFDAFHRLAEARREAERLFRDYDALLLPTAPSCPSLAEVAADPIGANARLGTYTNFVNLCDLAAIAVPAGFEATGLAKGVTLIGPAWSEGRLAALADAMHRENTDHVGATRTPLPPSAAPDVVAADETALFCIGAHMGGLPLNHQLTQLGGRYVRATETVPRYRLHALGDRPGMLRAQDGVAVAGEVWALPTAALGALLAQVASPLGLGQVELSDGMCLGFLAEADGVTEAPDISRCGGWRAWLAAREAA